MNLIRNFSVLAWGTIFSQMIGFIFISILARIYQPEQFAVWSIIIAINAILAPIVCGRMDIAYLTTRENTDKPKILISAIVLTIFVNIALILAVCLEFFYELDIKLFQTLDTFLYAIPLVTLSSSLVLMAKNILNSEREYFKISILSCLNAFLNGFIAVLFGALSETDIGMAVSFCLTSVFMGCISILMIKEKIYDSLKYRKNVKSIFEKYREFWVFNAPATFVDGLSVALPLLFVTKYYSAEIVGFYALMIRVATLPLSFISQSVSRLVIKEMSELFNRNEKVFRLFLKFSVPLIFISLVFCTVIQFYGPQLFTIFLGSEWVYAGEMLVILMPALALRFVASSTSSLFSATDNLKLGAFWKAIYFAISLIVFVNLSDVNFEKFVYGLLILDLVLYTFNYILQLYCVLKVRGGVK